MLAPSGEFRTPHATTLHTALDDALARLLLPSLEREIRRELSEEAEGHAVQVFARNLRSLLLQPPLHGRRVLAVDPGFRTGCKIAALDEVGNLLEDTIIYPHQTGKKGGKQQHDGKHAEAKAQEPKPQETPPPTPPPAEAVTEAPPAETPPAAEGVPVASAPSPEGTPPATEPAEAGAPVAEVTPPPAPATPPAPQISKREEAKNKLYDLVTRHHLNVIAIGNGTACRETEEFVSELINEKLPDLAYVIVNEAGASVYSASVIGREEFPDYDATLRGTISIGRRLQDPLSELVKVDPQSIGVGLYQHDVNPRHLKESLEGIIESCVNQVGVDLNTASVPLLRHVSGLNQWWLAIWSITASNTVPSESRTNCCKCPASGKHATRKRPAS